MVDKKLVISLIIIIILIIIFAAALILIPSEAPTGSVVASPNFTVP
tara:strand:+ start:24702 stop:24839 length:138 start_codon:yes stop_codon:yes gene_type:complete